MQEGDLIADSFLLQQRTAAGGMGAVFRARDVRSGRSVAVKTWLPTALDEEGLSSGPSRTERALLRFEREASVLSLLDDPTIVRYIAHGVTRDGEPFLVMHWVEGEDLARTLRERGLTLSETLLLALRLVAALGTLHERGIVHRDLKPANVMLERNAVSRAVLVDFGVARRSQLASVTVSGARVGTPCYMAPEQIRNAREVDGRADVFALGCVLFECLCGARAFRADDALGTIAQILLDDAPDLLALRAELPAPVVELVTRMMSRDRNARPAADAALQAELRGLLEMAERADLGPARPARSNPAAFTRQTALGAEDAQQSGYRAPASPALRAPAERVGIGNAQPISALIGRSSELSHVCALLDSGARTLVLWGPAGIGKTRLAQEPFDAAGPLSQARCFIELAGARDLEDALSSVLSRIGARVSGAEPVSSAIARALSQRGRLLVVLDAVDPFARELAPLLAEWQASASGVRFIVTARERWHGSGAVNFELGPLSLRPEDDTQTGLAREPSWSARLFIERVRERDARFSPDPQAQRSIEQIVQQLEGIPLAIELAATQVNLLGLDGVLSRVTRVTKGSGELEPPSRSNQPSVNLEHTMRDAIRTSFDLLTEEESAVLQCCAVFAGSFTLAAANAVIESQALTRPLLDVLQALREKSLLCSGSSPDQSAAPRLAFFAVIRDYARSLLRQSGEEARVRQRHAAYYQTLIRTLLGLRTTRSNFDLQKQVEIESGDLIAVIDHALTAPATDITLALEALLALEPLIVARGALPVFLTRLDRVIEQAVLGATPSPTLFAHVLLIRGRLLATRAQFARAESDLEHGRELARNAGDARLEGFAWLELGVSHHLQQRLAEAHDCYQRALELLRHRAQLRAEGRCYGNLGALLHDQAKLTLAAAHYWKAIHLLEEAGEARELGNFVANLAVLEQELGALAPARRHYEHALSLLSEAQDARLRAIALGNLGTLEAETKHWLAARERHEQALELLLPLDDRRSEALCRARLATSHAVLGSYKLAEAEYARAQRLQSAADPAPFEAIRLQRAFLDLCLAKSALSENDPAEAKVRLEQAEARVAHVEQHGLEGRSLLTFSDDLRLTLRLLKPMLKEFRERL